jgi:hypothetical protein
MRFPSFTASYVLYRSATLTRATHAGVPCLNSRISRFTLMTDTQHQCRLSGIEPAIQWDAAGTLFKMISSRRYMSTKRPINEWRARSSTASRTFVIVAKLIV